MLVLSSQTINCVRYVRSTLIKSQRIPRNILGRCIGHRESTNGFVVYYNIVDFYVRDDKRFVVEPVEMTYRNNPGEVATEKFKMYHIQLPAFRKEHKTLESVKGDTFNSWLYTFDRGYQSPEEMEVLSSMSEGLRNFAAQYHYAIHDPDLIRHYRMIEDGKRDVATQISVAETKARLEGEREGRREGRREGKLEATKENARRMKAKGYPSADIAEITGLSVADIEKLA